MNADYITEARAAFDAGEFEKAIAAVHRLHESGYITEATIGLAHDSYMKMGELHKALGELNRLRILNPGSGTDRRARRLLGRLIETDVSWLPTVSTQQKPEPEPSDPNRILHFLKESIPYSETGFTMRSRMTLRAQKLAGFTPQVVTSLGFPRSKGVTDPPASQVLDGVLHHHLDLGDSVDISLLPFDVSLTKNANMAAAIADTFLPELVQSGTGYRGFETALLGIAMARRFDTPFVYEVRGFQEQTWTGNIERSEKGEYYRRRLHQEDRCMTAADLIITIADAMAAEIAERGFPPEKIAVVPNAVDVNRFTPREKSGPLMDQYGLRDRFVLGYISNLGAREGIDQLIRAVGILRSRQAHVKCLIAGDGPERKRLDALVEELDLQDYVVLAGHVPNHQIEDYYALIDLFVVPRIDDRASRLVTPLKPLEAMSMKLPVISSSLPALEELVAPGVRGEVFEPSDPASLADVVNGLVNDDAARNRYGEAGYAWVHQERTLESNSRRYHRILSPLL